MEKNITNQGFISAKLFIIIVIIIILGAAYYLIPKQDDVVLKDTVEIQMSEATIQKDDNIVAISKDAMEGMMDMTYSYTGTLADVTNKALIRGVDTQGKSSGIAKATIKDDKYHLLVTFDYLPDPQGTDFYEGWIVRRGVRFSVISTGEVEKIDGVYTNMYQSSEDLTDHSFYVLTLEPDDGDPAPADHILEGELSK